MWFMILSSQRNDRLDLLRPRVGRVMHNEIMLAMVSQSLALQTNRSHELIRPMTDPLSITASMIAMLKTIKAGEKGY